LGDGKIQDDLLEPAIFGSHLILQCFHQALSLSVTFNKTSYVVNRQSIIEFIVSIAMAGIILQLFVYKTKRTKTVFAIEGSIQYHYINVF